MSDCLPNVDDFFLGYQPNLYEFEIMKFTVKSLILQREEKININLEV